MQIRAYARVSSREQALGTSLQDQQDVLSKYAATRGLTGPITFYVEAESAVHEKFERREKIKQLLSDLKPGDLVLCDKLDRWSRDPEFTYRSMREIRERGASVYFVGEAIDPSTSDGDSILGGRIWMAREEHKRIKLRTVGTRKLLRNQGLYAEGKTPVGYQRQEGRQKNHLVVDPDGSAVVQEIFRRSAAGASLRELTQYGVANDSPRKWEKKSLTRLLRNRIYLGEIKNSQGLWIKAQHPAIISAELFSQVQTSLARRYIGRPKEQARTRDWLLKGLARCARCSKYMSPAYGGRTREHNDYIDYYRCRGKCGAGYVPVREADRLATAIILERLKELRLELSRPPDRAPAPPKDLEKRRQKLDQKRDRLLEQNLDGHISREELTLRMAKLDLERTELDALEAPRVPDRAEYQAMLAHVEQLQRAWEHTTIDERRMILRNLAKEVRLLKGQRPEMIWNDLRLAVG